MSEYKHAIQLFKLHNSTNMSDDWVELNFQQNYNGRNEKLQIFTTSNYKVGQNILVNRFKASVAQWLNQRLQSQRTQVQFPPMFKYFNTID